MESSIFRPRNISLTNMAQYMFRNRDSEKTFMEQSMFKKSFGNID